MVQRVISCFGLVLAVVLSGCASSKGPVAFEIEASQYAQAIDVVRDTLRDARFQIDRVDAEDGVISTRPKPSAGLATPWDVEQPNLSGEVADLVNQHERVARVLFENDDSDLVSGDGPIRARVEVVVYRVRRGGWRVETESISRSTHARDPLSASRGQAWTFRQPIRRDDVFAGVLADRMRKKLGISQDPARP